MSQGYTKGAPQATTASSGIARIATIDEMLAGSDPSTMATPMGVAEYVAQKAGSANVETGTWTPTFTFATSGNLTVSYTIQNGRYTRVGDLVFVTARCSFTPTHTTASGIGYFSLPVASASGEGQVGLNFYIGSSVTVPTNTIDITGVPDPGNSRCSIISSISSSVGVSWTTTQYPTGAARNIYYSGFYKASTSAGNSGTFVAAVTTGTFTPTFTFTTPGTLSVVYTSQIGSYVRIGNLVTVYARCAFTPTLGTASGNARIAGLPYTVDATFSTNQLVHGLVNNSVTFPASTTSMGAVFVQGTSEVQLSSIGSGTGSSAWGTSQFPNATARDVFFTGTYITSDSNSTGTAQQIREVLNQDRSYYVATTGSDTSNNGLTVGAPFLTIQKAIDVVSSRLDLNGHKVTINVADGTYGPMLLRPVVGAIGYTSSLVGNAQSSYVEIIGNTTTPTNVSITSSTASVHALMTESASGYFVSGFSFSTTGSALNCVLALGARLFLGKVNFGACTTYHIATGVGAFIQMTDNYTINGSAVAHLQAQEGGEIDSRNRTVTITGTPAFTTGFAFSIYLGFIRSNGMSFSGAATGARYYVSVNAVIYTGGAATFFPGNAANTSTLGGVYA